MERNLIRSLYCFEYACLLCLRKPLSIFEYGYISFVPTLVAKSKGKYIIKLFSMYISKISPLQTVCTIGSFSTYKMDDYVSNLIVYY